MLVKVNHNTRYTYSKAVFLEPHTLRLTPREDPSQALLESNLVLDPEPAGMSKNVEQDGTLTHQVWFEDMTDHFSINSSFIILLKDKDPFEFIVHPKTALELPMKYDPEVLKGVKDDLISLTDSKKVKGYALETAYEVGNQTIPFLTTLADKIYKEFQYEYREFGDPYLPSKTFHNQGGSCRDLTLLYMAMCRSMGLAARFVSGYFFDDTNQHPPELHAWVEVFIPGGGWRGFDPTNGIAVASHHVVLAASNDYRLTAPVSGTLRGDATTTIKTQVEFKKLKDTEYGNT